jgi:four helix bundle protein
MKKYDLEERTFNFAKEVRLCMLKLRKIHPFESDIQQVIRASGSIGANYLEANNSLSKKDFLYRLRISQKEAKECHYWLRLISDSSLQENEHSLQILINEVVQLRNILSAIILKSGG